VTSRSRTPHIDDLAPVDEMRAQAAHVHIPNFVDFVGLDKKYLCMIASISLWIAWTIWFGGAFADLQCDSLRPSVCHPFTLPNIVTGAYWNQPTPCQLLSFSPLDYSFLSESVRSYRPIANWVGSTYTEWRRCESASIVPMDVGMAIRNWSARELIFYAVFVAVLVFYRRTTWYTALEWVNNETEYDMRELGNFARKAVVRDAKLRRYRVTEVSGVWYIDLKNLFTGKLTREVVIPIETFISLQGSRQQCSAFGPQANLLVNLIRRCEIEDTVALDRYIATIEQTHVEAVKFAYHYSMSQQRHRLSLF